MNTRQYWGQTIQRARASFWTRFVVFPLLALGLGLGASIAAGSIVFGQTDEKLISLDKQTTNYPIKFSNLTVGTKPRNFEEIFHDSKGWIQKVSFDAENISEREIIALEVRVLFPTTKATGRMMYYTFTLGNRPGLPPNVPKGATPPLSLKKGEKISISLAPHYERIAEFIGNRLHIDSVNTIQLEPSFIFFSDGTAFRIGTYMRQHPDIPTRWIPIETTKQELR